MALRVNPGQMLLFPVDALMQPAVNAVLPAAKAAQAAASAVPPVLAAEPRPLALKLDQPKLAQPKIELSKLELSKLEQLRAQVDRLQARGRLSGGDGEPHFSAGSPSIDQLLPHGGLRRGTVVQWVGESGGGAWSLAMIAAAGIAKSEMSGGKPLVVFDLNQEFYPPAAVALGVPADRMMVIHKRAHHTRSDMIWAIDQALRCEAISAVWCELGSWVNDRDARRLQLAAEAGGTVGLFVRPEEVRRRPSFADVSWHVSPYRDATDSSSRRRLRVEVDRCRGGAEGAVAMVDLGSLKAVPLQSSKDLQDPRDVRSQHESKVVSDLARRLADPAIAKRTAVDRQRDSRRPEKKRAS
jgi:protein ImuA